MADKEDVPVVIHQELPPEAVLQGAKNRIDDVARQIRSAATAFAEQVDMALSHIDEGAEEETWQEISAAIQAHGELAGQQFKIVERLFPQLASFADAMALKDKLPDGLDPEPPDFDIPNDAKMTQGY